jgi:hypothetical protein
VDYRDAGYKKQALFITTIHSVMRDFWLSFELNNKRKINDCIYPDPAFANTH